MQVHCGNIEAKGHRVEIQPLHIPTPLSRVLMKASTLTSSMTPSRQKANASVCACAPVYALCVRPFPVFTHAVVYPHTTCASRFSQQWSTCVRVEDYSGDEKFPWSSDTEATLRWQRNALHSIAMMQPEGGDWDYR